MKYLIVIADGMADNPLKELEWRTPLQVASHPAMDSVAARGVCGTLRTLPEGFEAGSDVAIMSILGYDPLKYYTGRGPLEAASIGVDLGKEDVAFRCNLITQKEGLLEDYSAGHIGSDEARKLILSIKREYGREEEIEFHPGVSYRHLLVLRGRRYSDRVVCVPPHDAMGKAISDILIKPIDSEAVETADLLNRMILDSERILQNHEVNMRRAQSGAGVANMIWFWGQGRRPQIRSLYDRFGVKGAVISAVNVVKGLGILAGMDIIEVPGATGYLDTNYEGKADYAVEGLENHDLVIVHIEAPDEAGHSGDPHLKIKAIEDLDNRLIKRILKQLHGEYALAVLPDHATPCDMRTHTKQPVPFAFFSTSMQKEHVVERFDENSIHASSFGQIDATSFLNLFLRI
jgi:2,3-bisphosphoglycerate-independent phosphoglycerate mutase